MTYKVRTTSEIPFGRVTCFELKGENTQNIQFLKERIIHMTRIRYKMLLNECFMTTNKKRNSKIVTHVTFTKSKILITGLTSSLTCVSTQCRRVKPISKLNKK